MNAVRVMLAACILLLVPLAAAVIETYEFSSPALEERYHALSQELRCPKCQNQNIADSNAPIAKDLRRQLYQQLESGASDEEILAFMVARYGEFVRYRPSVTGPTLALWLAPAVLLLLAVGLVLLVLRSRRRTETALDAEERRRLEELLAREKDA